MQKPVKASEYLLLSRGKWDPSKSPEEVQKAIDDFYVWHEKLVTEGKFKTYVGAPGEDAGAGWRAQSGRVHVRVAQPGGRDAIDVRRLVERAPVTPEIRPP